MNKLCTKFKKRRDKENHRVFERMISHNRKSNPVFNDMINQIIKPSDKSKARRDAAMERQRVQEAIRVAADVEKKATKAKENSK